ncbi:MAG: hypothetical protein AAGD07_01575 [Planctomycetota bacterium]
MRHEIHRTIRFSTKRGVSSTERIVSVQKTRLDPPILENVGGGPCSSAPSETRSLPQLSLRASLSHGRFFRCDDIRFTNVTDLSRKIQPGELVIYRIGEDDPINVIADALARGAAGVLTEQLLPAPIPQCIVPCVDHAAATLSACAAADSETDLIIVGVMGPSGKSCVMASTKAVLEKIPCQVSDHPHASEPVITKPEAARTDADTTSSIDAAEWLRKIQADERSGASVSLVELNDDELRSGSYDRLSLDILVVASPESRESDFGPSPLQAALERLSGEGVVICDAGDTETRERCKEAGVVTCTYSSTQKTADVHVQTLVQEHGLVTGWVQFEKSSAAFETDFGHGLAMNAIAAASAVGVVTQTPLASVAEAFSGLVTPEHAFRRVPSESWDVPAKLPRTFCDRAGTPSRVQHVLQQARRIRMHQALPCIPIQEGLTAKPGKNGGASPGKLWCVLAVQATDDAETLARYGHLLETLPDEVVLTCNPNDKVQFLRLGHGVLDGVQDCAALRLVADRSRAVAWAIAEAKPEDTVMILGDLGDSASPGRQESLEAWLRRLEQSGPRAESAQPSLKLFSA